MKDSNKLRADLNRLLLQLEEVKAWGEELINMPQDDFTNEDGREITDGLHAAIQGLKRTLDFDLPAQEKVDGE